MKLELKVLRSLRLSAKAPGKDRKIASERGESCQFAPKFINFQVLYMFRRGYTLNSILGSLAIAVAVRGACHAATSKRSYWVMFETSEPRWWWLQRFFFTPTWALNKTNLTKFTTLKLGGGLMGCFDVYPENWGNCLIWLVRIFQLSWLKPPSVGSQFASLFSRLSCAWKMSPYIHGNLSGGSQEVRPYEGVIKHDSPLMGRY